MGVLASSRLMAFLACHVVWYYLVIYPEFSISGVDRSTPSQILEYGNPFALLYSTTYVGCFPSYERFWS
jgi:hypothetical protein